MSNVARLNNDAKSLKICIRVRNNNIMLIN